MRKLPKALAVVSMLGAVLGGVTSSGQAGLLDSVSGATAAYSLRRLSDSYTGAGAYAVRVRRSSDSTMANIGFDVAGNLDTAALLDFVGSGDGYVTTWYDQTGGLNVTDPDAANQPQIVRGGAVITAANGNSVFQSTSVTIDQDDNFLAIGGYDTGGLNFGLHGYLQEVIFYGDLGTTGRLAVEAEVMRTYGIIVPEPSGLGLALLAVGGLSALVVRRRVRLRRVAKSLANPQSPITNPQSPIPNP